MSQYINEAFKQLRLLESEDLDLSPTGLDTLDTFMNQAMSDEDIDIIDLEAEAEEDLKKSYIGKVICDCNVCHSNIFYNKEDIVIDEDGIVNPEEECPYCMSLDGYTIVGEIKPYEEGVAEESEDEVDLDVDLDDDEEAEEPIEIESEEDDDLDESLQLSESDKKSIEDYESTILKIFNTNGQEVVDSYIKDNILVVECDNSNPTLITDLRRSLKRKLPDNIEFDSEGNDNGFYGKTYEFYIYDDLDESLTEAFSKGQDVYIKPSKRVGKIKSHIKNDLYEVETYDGEDKGLPDRVDTYYASDLELKESLPLSGVAKLKGKKTLRRRDEHDGCKCILGRNNTELSGDKDLHESIELGDDGQTIWSGVPVREDSIANNPHTTNRMIWADDDEEGYIEYLVSLGIPDEQLCHEFYKRGWNSEDALEEYKKSGLSLHESIDDTYNDVMTPEEARKYWDAEKDNNPVLVEFDNFQDWYDESVKNSYIKESIELGDDGQTIWAGVPVRKDSIANNPHKTNRLIWADDDEEGYIDYLVRKGISDEQLCHEFYKKGWDIEDALKEYRNKDLHESIENVSIDTDDETMTMTTKEDGGVVIETSPKEEFEETFGEEEPTELETGDEMIAPLDPETEDELGITDESEEDMGFDFGEETPEEDVDIEEFDEETFDGLGESYLRRCYENVNSFKTTNVICNENLLTVEGNIGFKSGNVKKTSFIFEAKESNNGKYVFEGYNNEINIGKKAFRLNCSIDNKKIIPESLNYNYRSKNDLNESVKLHGTVKAPKRG